MTADQPTSGSQPAPGPQPDSGSRSVTGPQPAGAHDPAFDAQNVFGQGAFNEAYARYFSGASFLNPLTDRETAHLAVTNVTFEPGCRNAWHVHRAASGGGQVLLCTAGSGWYQAEGQEPVSLAPGSVVAVPANVRHWHGAKAGSWFSHIAIEVPGEGTSTEWHEPVSDDHYDAL